MTRRLRRPTLSVAAMVGTLAVCSVAISTAAAPTLDLTITPTNPYVDDNVRIAFSDPAPIPAASEVDVVLAGTGACGSSLAFKAIKGPKLAGRRYVLTFRPSEQIVGEGQYEWCDGTAKVAITEAKNEHFRRKLAEKHFRFLRKP